MPTVSFDSPSFSGLSWALKFLPSKYTDTSIWLHRMIEFNMSLLSCTANSFRYISAAAVRYHGAAATVLLP